MKINNYNNQFYYHNFDGNIDEIEEFLKYFNNDSNILYHKQDDSYSINFGMFDKVIEINIDNYLIIKPSLLETSIFIKYRLYVLTEKEFNILTFCYDDSTNPVNIETFDKCIPF